MTKCQEKPTKLLIMDFPEMKSHDKHISLLWHPYKLNFRNKWASELLPGFPGIKKVLCKTFDSGNRTLFKKNGGNLMILVSEPSFSAWPFQRSDSYSHLIHCSHLRPDLIWNQRWLSLVLYEITLLHVGCEWRRVLKLYTLIQIILQLQ